jgi:hypothetical protein
MSNFRLESDEAPSPRPWLAVAAGAVALVVALLWADAAFDQPPGRLFVGLSHAAPIVILVYLAATAAEWLTRSEKDNRLDDDVPRWIAKAHGFVFALFLAAAVAQLLLLVMLAAAMMFAPNAIGAIAPTLILTVIGSVIGVMALRAPLYLAAVIARLTARLKRRQG